MNGFLDAAAVVDTRWVLFVLLAVLDLWSGGLVVFSDAPRKEKALWVGVILACPIIGCLFWFVFGPKWSARSARV